MLAFLSQLLSRISGAIGIASEHLTAMGRKSASTAKDVTRMKKIHIRHSLAEDNSPSFVSAIDSPTRTEEIVKKILTSSQHHEGTPVLWTSQAKSNKATGRSAVPSASGRRKKMLNSIGQRRMQALSRWHER